MDFVMNICYSVGLVSLIVWLVLSAIASIFHEYSDSPIWMELIAGACIIAFIVSGASALTLSGLRWIWSAS